MKRTSTHFGLTFKSDFILEENDRHEFAKLLLLSPSVDASQAGEIPDGIRYFLGADDLMDEFNAEIQFLNRQVNQENTPFGLSPGDAAKRFEEKFATWVRIYGVPSKKELRELAEAFPTLSEDRLRSIVRQISPDNFPSVKEISKTLSASVIGQENAVNTMAVVIMEERMRMEAISRLPKTSPLLIGPTGSGKTMLVSESGKILGLPMVRINCGELVPEGYKGNTINKYLAGFYQKPNSPADTNPHCIIYLDELDKVAGRNHIGDDAMKCSIQFELIKLFDPDQKICFQGTENTGEAMVAISTNDLVLIFSGAFSGIEEMIRERLLQEVDGNLSLIDQDNLIHYCTTDDLQCYGIIPELASRISYITPLRSLNEDDIVRIMKESQESEMKKHIAKCEALGISLQLTDPAMEKIARIVVSRKMGARYLGTCLQILLKDLYMNSDQWKGRRYVVG